MSEFVCQRCGNDKDEGCGMPDFKVPVLYEGGRIEYVTPACPLDFKSPLHAFWFGIKPTSLIAMIKGLFS